MTHPRTELVPYLSGELTPGARARVEAHLAACSACRGEAERFAELVHELRRSVPEAPPVHWGRWRAELRDRLSGVGRRWWYVQPLPLALSAALAGALVVVAWLGVGHQPARIEIARQDPAAVEDVLVDDRLDLMSDYQVVERLDLLEDVDVIRQLDQLAPAREG